MNTNFLKKAKDWIRYGLSISKYNNLQEKKLCEDDEHKPYIRGKRRKNYLPDSYTYTRWIHRPGHMSWKTISKNKKQYYPHKKSYNELVTYDNTQLYEEEQFLYLLKKKYKNDWYYFYYTLNDNGSVDLNKLFNVRFENYWYDTAERLVNKGILIGQYYTHKWTFNDCGTIQIKSAKYLTAVKIKES